jgi:membrane protease YdiL (CAAX protease family)
MPSDVPISPDPILPSGGEPDTGEPNAAGASALPERAVDGAAGLPIPPGEPAGTTAPEAGDAFPQPPGPAPGDRPLALLEMVLVSGILSDILAVVLAGWLTGIDRAVLYKQPLGMFVFLMISTVFILGLTALCQCLRRGNPELRLGFRPVRGWGRELLLAGACLPVVFVTLWTMELLIALWDPRVLQEVNPVLAVIRTPGDLTLFLISGVIAGGIREEVQRAFIIRRSAVYFWSPWVGLLLWSVLFGLAHSTQGTAAMVITGLLGLEFGIFYLWRRALPVPVLVHALFNVAVLLVYWYGR